MEYRNCGKTDLKLSAIGCGCWAFGGGKYWGEQNQADVNAVVRAAVDNGINYFDTAEAYNEGRSEESLGIALKGVPREKAVVGTKVSPDNCYPGTLAEHCERSMKRLGVDYIDLYMIHWPIHPHSIRHFTSDEKVIKNPPKLEDAVAELQKLRAEGKVRYVGVSNFAPNRLKDLVALEDGIAVNQLPYSLLTRAIELETIPFCVEHGIGVIGYMTLLQGLLADIYPTLADVPVWQRRTRHFDSAKTPECRHGERGFETETEEAIDAVRAVCKGLGMKMPDVATRWAIANKAVSCALVGARNVEELKENAKAADDPLPDDAVQKLDQSTSKLLEKLGSGFDYYESKANDRTR